MALSETSKALIKALVQPIQSQADPLAAVDQVIDEVALNSVLDSTPYDFLSAIDDALKGDTQLSSLAPQGHSDAVLRQFLATLEQRLTEMGFRRVDLPG